MTDDMTPDATNHDRRLAHSWAETVKANPDNWGRRQLAAARVILHDLPDPPPPTLADMTTEDRVGCKGMQADLKGDDSPVVIVTTKWLNDTARVMWPDFRIGAVPQRSVTPRPDLPRLAWPGTEKPAPALPEGWRLADHPDHGYVMVTNTTPNRAGNVCFVMPAVDGDPRGFAWHLCSPNVLTYIDQEDDQ